MGCFQERPYGKVGPMRSWWKIAFVGTLGASFVVAPLLFGASEAMAVAATPAQAASKPPAGSPGQGLEISPPVLELNANPGEKVTVQIRVRNVTNGVLIAKGKADDFGAGTDESGQPKLLLDETGATRFSLKYWVSSVPDLQLAPSELKTTIITIAVPSNAEPGGHFGVVRFTAVPPDLNGTGVALSASVGTLLLMKVAGPITDKLSTAQFSTGSITKAGLGWVDKSFFEEAPVDFLVRLKNEGSVHEKPKGNITITNMFGKKSKPVVVNQTGGNVLPDSIRRFESSYKDKGLFGYYSATVNLTYANNQTLTAKTSFWVLPWKMILVVMSILVVAAILLRFGLKRYNDWIISQARRR
jgi:hypothetical protein